MESEALYIEQDGDQFNDLWLACAVIFGVLLGFFLGVAILFVIRKNFPAKYTKVNFPANYTNVNFPATYTKANFPAWTSVDPP